MTAVAAVRPTVPASSPPERDPVPHLPVLVRRVVAAHPETAAVDLTAEGYGGRHLDGAPGWLTGEDPQDQGVELTMPNLPHLDLPDATPVAHRLRLDLLAGNVLRLRSGEPSSPVFDDDGTGLGIVTKPRLPGAVAAEVSEA